jgi:predicted esterase
MQNLIFRFARIAALIAVGLSSLDGASAANRITEQLTIGKIPVLVSRPPAVDARTRLVLLYHGFGEPASPKELAQALPLADSNVVAAYVNLPLVADRMPEGGVQELMRIQRVDFVNGLFYRSIAGAVQEMPSLVSELGTRFGIDVAHGVGLFGFSAGGSAVLLALMDCPVPISAAVVVNAPFSVRQNVASWESALHRSYDWDEPSLRAAEHFDVQRHADRIASRTPRPAILVLQSASDEHLDVEPAVQAVAALKSAYESRGSDAAVELRILDNSGHNFSAADAAVATAASGWFRAHLAHRST